jgi:hypothetical protein
MAATSKLRQSRAKFLHRIYGKIVLVLRALLVPTLLIQTYVFYDL